jgi:nucleoside-diphosphate-sugar epimerase
MVTGGSGFVGGRLIERLVADGNEVRALARSGDSAAKVEGLGAEPARGDITDRGSLEAAAAGCEVVFHAAAKVEDSGPWSEFQRDNVEGTRNAVEAAAAAGARRFVHVSTEAVLIAGDPLVNVDETAPLRTDSRAPYPRSKAMAEQVVNSAAGIERVIVRPRFIWGKGDTSLLPGIVTMVESGRFAWIGGGRHRTDTTHVDSVVEGLVLAAQRGGDGETYFITDGKPVVFREFLTDLLATQGVKEPRRSMPAPLAGALAAVGESAWNLLPLPGAPPLSRFAYWASAQECTIDIAKARRELGYEPVKSHEEGLAEMRSAQSVGPT